MSLTGIKAAEAFVAIKTDQKKLLEGLKTAEARIKAWGGRVGNIGKTLMANGTALAAPMALSAKIFMDFDDQMRAVQGVTQSTASELLSMTERAKELGRTTSFSASQVASGMGELGRIGFKSDQINVAIADVMNLSRATGTDLALATEIAGNVMNGFSLDASKMGHIADVLTATANASAVSVEDLGESFKFAAPMAASVGMSLEDTAKYLGMLGNFGIKGSEAGNSIKSVQTRLADTKIQKYLKTKLNIDTTDAEGNLRNLAEIMTDLGKATNGLGSAERLQIYTKVFGKQYIASGAKLATASADALSTAIDNCSQVSARTAKTMDAGLGGSFRSMQSAVEGAAIAVGDAVAPLGTSLLNAVTSLSSEITTFASTNKGLVNMIASISGVAILAGGALTGFGTGLKLVGKAIPMVVSGFKAMKIASVFLFTNPIGIAITAASVAIGIFAYKAHEAEKALQKVRDAAAESLTKIEEFESQCANANTTMTSLQLISGKPLGDSEFEAAKRKVQELEKTYGSLGITMDSVAKTITLAADAQDRLLAAQTAEMKDKLTDSINAKKTERKALAKKHEDVTANTYWNNMTRSDEGRRKEGREIAQEIGVVDEEIAQLEARLNALTHGDQTQLTPRQTAQDDNVTLDKAAQEQKETSKKSAQEQENNLKKIADYQSKIAEERKSDIQREIDEIDAETQAYQRLLQSVLDYENARPDGERNATRIAEMQSAMVASNQDAERRKQAVFQREADANPMPTTLQMNKIALQERLAQQQSAGDTVGAKRTEAELAKLERDAALENIAAQKTALQRALRDVATATANGDNGALASARQRAGSAATAYQSALEAAPAMEKIAQAGSRSASSRGTFSAWEAVSGGKADWQKNMADRIFGKLKELVDKTPGLEYV